MDPIEWAHAKHSQITIHLMTNSDWFLKMVVYVAYISCVADLPSELRLVFKVFDPMKGYSRSELFCLVDPSNEYLFISRFYCQHKNLHKYTLTKG